LADRGPWRGPDVVSGYDARRASRPRGKLNVSIRDHHGNLKRVERTFAIGKR
jgi:hypothetical protein